MVSFGAMVVERAGVPVFEQGVRGSWCHLGHRVSVLRARVPNLTYALGIFKRRNRVFK